MRLFVSMTCAETSFKDGKICVHYLGIFVKELSMFKGRIF